MVSISEVKASNTRIPKATAPHTAVFTGGTDGIGKATLTRLVATKLAIRIYVIGRNSERHKSFLDELRESNDQADIIWLEGQISLLAETKRLCDIIKARETSIDILFMSAGLIASGERTETSEGVLVSLSLCYYARISMMTQLLSLLNASSNNPRILSILAAGTETPSIYLDDLDLKKPENYGFFNLSKSTATYTTLTMSRLAQENPRVVLIHHYPGGVNTGLFKKAFRGKWYWWLLGLTLAVAGTSPEDAGEKAMYLLTSAKYGGQGFPLAAKELPGLTMAKTGQAGSLFLINDRLQELQQEKLMEELNKMDAGKIVWQKALETIGRDSSPLDLVGVRPVNSAYPSDAGQKIAQVSSPILPTDEDRCGIITHSKRPRRQMERRATGHGSSSYGQACMQCFKAKCRCFARPDSDGCERCLRLKKRCQPSEAVRKRGVQNHQTGAQIAELEGKIDLLTTTLQSVVKATGVSVDLSPPLSESLSAVSMGETNSISINTTHDMGAWPTPSTPTHLGGSSQPFSPPLYDPTPNEADGYLNLFRNRMLPYFPFIYMSPGMTALELRRDRPFLFQAIVAVATPSTQHKVARIEVLKYVWAKFVMVENQSTIDILLSILTYITWSTDPFLERSSNLSRMIMLATSLLNNLQRANPAPPEAHIIATMAPGLGETDWDVSEASVPGFLEQRRAVLACFVLSSIISSYYRRTDAIWWTPQMEEALHVISMNEVCPSDEAFAFQVRLQLVAQKVAQVREQHKADRTDVATLPPPTSLYLEVLQKQLQELKASLSPYLRQMDMLTAYVHYVELCIDEVTRLASSNTPLLATPEIAGHGGGNVPGFERLECLWRCLQAVKLWLDVFYTVSPAAYVGLPFFYWFQLVRCIVILKHLSTFEDPAWDCQVVHNTVDMLRLLEWMAEKTELASKEAGEQSDDDLFQQVSKMLRLSQAWVKAKRKPAVPVAEGPTSNPSADPPLATAGDVMADSSQTVWMDAFESGDQSWFEDFLGWSPGTL